MERRLAAILAADVVGYSKLIGDDEAGTLAAFKTLRTGFVEPLVAEHRGRVVKLLGDGFLVEFASAVDAVNCAVAWQKDIRQRQSGKPFQFRIGVNLGDIVIDEGDIFGDGVNIAARLEAQAQAGGVLVSEAVHDQVSKKIDVTFEAAGEVRLKNIDRPVRVWRWGGDGTIEVATAGASGIAATLPLPDKPSLAVLPFDNMSGDPEQEFFADGMAEDIITALSRMPWFFVIARNSSFTYKGRAIDVKQIAGELGVKYVLEGSVRKSGNRLRITAQLIDATTGQHVWAERFDRQIVDIFDIQDEVTQAIVGAIAPEFLSVEAKQARKKDPALLDAWECVMRGRAHLWKMGRDDASQARRLFERAIELAPSGEFGTSDLAIVFHLEAYYRWTDNPEDSLARMVETAEKAVVADDTDVWALTILSWANIFAHRWEEALPPVERAIELSPNFASAIGLRGAVHSLLGNPEQGIADHAEAVRLSPRDGMMVFWTMGLYWAYHCMARYDEAAETARRGIRLAPHNPTFRRQLASALWSLGREEEARCAVKDYLEIAPGHTTADAGKVPSRDREPVDRFVEALRMAGLPD
jgi:TolB-like protein